MRIGFVSTHASTFLKNLRKLAILLFRSNVPASVVRHDTRGKHVPDSGSNTDHEHINRPPLFRAS